MILKLLKDNNININKHIKKCNTDTIKVNSNLNMAILYSNDNTFTVSRELFDYLSSFDEKYAFCLVNKKENKIYYLEFREKINWLKSSFETCNKDRLFFGKIVLQHKVTTHDLLKKLI